MHRFGKERIKGLEGGKQWDTTTKEEREEGEEVKAR